MRLCSMIFICRVRSGGIEPWYEVRSSDAAEALFNITSFLRLIPEEILPLGEFFFLTFRREDGFERIGVVAGVPSLGGNGHRGWRKVLYLFEVEVETLGDDSEFGHIFLMAAGMGGDEVGDNLLVQVLFAVDTVEDALEGIELLERGLAHEMEHTVGGMFRGHFQTARDMAGDEFAGVFLGRPVRGLVLTFI